MAKRHVLISILATIFAICMIMCVAGLASIKTVKAEALIVFEEGASIRIDTQNTEDQTTTGIRFAATVDSSLFDMQEIGMIIVPEFVVNEYENQDVNDADYESDYFAFFEKEYGATKAEIAKSITKEQLIKNSGKMQGVIARILDENYNVAYMPIAYYYDGSSYTYYKADFSRTIANVADQALSDTQSSFTSEQKQAIGNVLEKAVSLSAGGLSYDLAIGKTIDLGREFTNGFVQEKIEWTINGSSSCVKKAVGGDNVQALSSGTAILSGRAYNGAFSIDVTINACAATKAEEVVDFVIDVPSGRDIKVLQITDTQLIDSSQVPFNALLNDLYKPENFEENCFKYIREAVRRTNPDLIIMTGDNVWGSYDPNGSALKKLIEVLDSFEIPWAAVNGNHENECVLGAQWQNQQYEESKYGLFNRGVTDGNGNYSIGLRQDGEIKRVFYMMDSNFCSAAANPSANYVTTSKGFTQNQVDWFNLSVQKLHEIDADIPISMAYHISTDGYDLAEETYLSDPSLDTYYFRIGLDVESKNGDFGCKNSKGTNNNSQFPTYNGKTLLEIFKENKVDSTFVGHEHELSTSILYEGIRWTYGLKTGIYDISGRQDLGGTLIAVSKTDGTVDVEHVYYDQEYQALMDNLPENVTFNGMAIEDKEDTIAAGVGQAQRTGVSKTVVDGFGAYRIDATIQIEMHIKDAELTTCDSISFSFYVPSDSTKRLGWPISAFCVMQRTSAGLNYMPFSEIGSETSSNPRNKNYNYDEWTTCTIPFEIDGKRATSFAWVIAAGNGIYLKDITLNEIPYSFEQSGQTLSAFTGDTYQLTGTGPNPEWISSDSSIASVDENGLVRFVGVGQAEITFKATGKNGVHSETVTFNVEQAPNTAKYGVDYYVLDIPSGDFIKDAENSYFDFASTQSEVEATVLEKEGYIVDQTKSTLKANVRADGTTILSVYYTIDGITIGNEYSDNRTETGATSWTSVGDGNYKYSQTEYTGAFNSTRIGITDKTGDYMLINVKYTSGTPTLYWQEGTAVKSTQELYKFNAETGKFEVAQNTTGEWLAYIIKVQDLGQSFDISFNDASGNVEVEVGNYVYITKAIYNSFMPLDKQDRSETTGNIAPYAYTDGIVSFATYVNHSNSDLFNYSDNNLHMWAGTNDIVYMLFDSTFIQEAFAKGYTTLSFTYSVDTTITTWSQMSLSYYDASENKYVEFGNKYKTSYVKVDQVYPETCEWEITTSMINQIKFSEGDKLVLGNLACGGQTLIKMIITNLEFFKKFYVTSGNLIADGSITSVATYSGTGSTNGPIYSTAFMYNGVYHVWSHTGKAEALTFDTDFIQDCFKKELTNINISFYMSNYNVETWGSLKLQYYDASENAYVRIGTESIAYRTTHTSAAPQTGTFTLTAEQISAIDFAGGDKLVIGSFAAGSNSPLKWIVTSIEFTNPKA